MLVTMDKNIILISVHSVIDVITNSSTELFVTSENLVEESFRDVYKALMEHAEHRQLDYETEILRLSQFEHDKNCEFIFKNEIDRDSVWIIDASYHNKFLNLMIEKYFNPIKEEDYRMKWGGL